MDHVVIVTNIDKNVDTAKTILKQLRCRQISVAKTCGEARMMSFDYDIDLYIFFSPIDNKSGEDLAVELCSDGISQAIMIVKNENYEYMASKVEDNGVLVLPGPIDPTLLYISLKFANATHNRLRGMQKLNTKLTQKIDDIKIIDRAKCLLISHLQMNEKQAHRYIETKAMDQRSSKRIIAETILRTYE